MRRARLFWRILLDALDGFWRNDGSAMAGYIAFTLLLAIFPFLIFLTMLVGTLIGEASTDDITHALFEIAPEDVATTLEPVVDEVVSGASERVLTLSAIFAIWVASNAVEAFRVAFDRAYQVIDPRGFFHARAVAVGFVFLGALVAALLGFSVLLAPLIIRILEQSLIPVPPFISYLANGFGLVVFTGFVHLMHRILPGQSVRGGLLWPGVLLSTTLWLVAAVGFSVYLTFTPTYSLTYGTLAGVIISLMFFYITGAAIIFGAEFNAALNRATGRFGKPDPEATPPWQD